MSRQSYRCVHCRTEVGTLELLRHHLQTHNLHYYNPLNRCKACSKCFLTRDHLTRHWDKVHKYLFHCQDGICFYTRDDAEQHACTWSDMLQAVVRIEAEQTHDCNHCPMRLSSLGFLREHIAQFHGYQSREYPCIRCPQRFCTEDALLRHCRRHTYQCVVCNKDLRSARELKGHMAGHEEPWRRHTGQGQPGRNVYPSDSETSMNDPATAEETRYKCNVCGLLCTMAETAAHAQSHNYFNGPQCTVCSGIFDSEERLRLHMSVKHAPAGSTAAADNRRIIVIDRAMNSNRAATGINTLVPGNTQDIGGDSQTIVIVNPIAENAPTINIDCPDTVGTAASEPIVIDIDPKAGLPTQHEPIVINPANYTLDDDSLSIVGVRRPESTRRAQRQRYKCNVCGLMCTIEETVDHAKSHDINERQCDDCFCIFPSARALREHIAKQHSQTIVIDSPVTNNAQTIGSATGRAKEIVIAPIIPYSPMILNVRRTILTKANVKAALTALFPAQEPIVIRPTVDVRTGDPPAAVRSVSRDTPTKVTSQDRAESEHESDMIMLYSEVINHAGLNPTQIHVTQTILNVPSQPKASQPDVQTHRKYEFECGEPTCKKLFACASDLKRHKNTCSAHVRPSILCEAPLPKPSQPEVQTKMKYVYECDEPSCTTFFTSKSHLEKHQRTCSAHVIRTILNNQPKPPTLPTKVQASINQIYKCGEQSCKKLFTSKSDHESHKRSAHVKATKRKRNLFVYFVRSNIQTRLVSTNICGFTSKEQVKASPVHSILPPIRIWINKKPLLRLCYKLGANYQSVILRLGPTIDSGRSARKTTLVCMHFSRVKSVAESSFWNQLLKYIGRLTLERKLMTGLQVFILYDGLHIQPTNDCSFVDLHQCTSVLRLMLAAVESAVNFK